jgi:hypothetical protein
METMTVSSNTGATSLKSVFRLRWILREDDRGLRMSPLDLEAETNPLIVADCGPRRTQGRRIGISSGRLELRCGISRGIHALS